MRFMPLVLALASLTANGFAEDQPVAGVVSTVEAATVFLDRAYVTRRAEVALAFGVQTLVFANLPPEIDEQSLRATVNGGAQIDGMQSRKVFLAQRQEADIRTLEAEMLVVETQLRELNDRKATLDKAHAFVDAVQEAPFRQVTGKDGALPTRPSVEEYQALLTFMTKQRGDQAAEQRAIDAARTELQPRLEAKRHELEQAKSASSLERREVVITLRSTQAGAGELRLSYLVPGALWIPIYDARANPERSKLELDYDALVQQATGEEWTNAQLTLSAARPAILAQSPKPAPWYLTVKNLQQAAMSNSLNPQSNGSMQSFTNGYANESIRDIMQSNDFLPSAGLYQYKGNRGSKPLNEAQDNLLRNAVAVDVISRAVEQRSTTAVFVVPGRNNVAANGKPHRMHIAHASLAMSTTLHAIPRTSLNAYITGKMVNTTEMPILPGAANVFVGADLIGSASLEFVAPRETASLYLGVDKSVKITRRLDEKNSGLTFLSKRKQLSFAYSIQARNFRSEAVQLAVYESLPVSQDERITIDLDTPVPKPQANDRGMMRWDLTLEPGKERTAAFSYRIEYPGDLVTEQLQQMEQGALKK
jgi:Domain of unknown function (DUF4139)/N-terminal domain of unknown function (DUF4140)